MLSVSRSDRCAPKCNVRKMSTKKLPLVNRLVNPVFHIDIDIDIDTVSWNKYVLSTS